MNQDTELKPGTAAWLINQLQALPPDSLVNVPTAYSWYPRPVIKLDHYKEIDGVVLDNGED